MEQEKRVTPSPARPPLGLSWMARRLRGGPFAFLDIQAMT